MYILVAEVDDLNQLGQYYVDAWVDYPSVDEVKTAIESSDFYYDYDPYDIDLVMESITNPSVNTNPNWASSWFTIKTK